jgi:hypothetical protein
MAGLRNHHWWGAFSAHALRVYSAHDCIRLGCGRKRDTSARKRDTTNLGHVLTHYKLSLSYPWHAVIGSSELLKFLQDVRARYKI